MPGVCVAGALAVNSRARRGLSRARRVLEKNANLGKKSTAVPAEVVPDDVKAAQILYEFQASATK